MTIHPQALELLPDPGAILLDRTPERHRSIVASQLSIARFRTGGYDRRGIRYSDTGGGPLRLLAWIRTTELAALWQWATADIDRDEDRDLWRAISTGIWHLCDKHGVPYATSWAYEARPPLQAQPDAWPRLATLLDHEYRFWADRITDDMVTKKLRW